MMKTTINGKTLDLDKGDLDKGLLDFLREDLDLTGAKNACGIGVCGACTILVNDKPTLSCRGRVADIVGKVVVTIEGLQDSTGNLHPIQQAFIDSGAVQCGFCTPGMILTAYGLLKVNSSPTREEIRAAIKRNLCRCTGYQQIIDAVEVAASYIQSAAQILE